MTGSSFEIDIERLLAEEEFVRRLARGLLFDDHRVDDVVQQTWLAALRNPPDQPGALRGWLAQVVRRIAANETRGQMRRARREQAAASGDAALPSADEVLEREERRHEIVDALAALAEPFRTAVALRYLEGLEPTEIARLQGIPAATVRTRVKRGLDSMREALDLEHGNRSAWALGLIPWLRSREAAATGMATTTLVPVTIAMKKLLFATAAALIALISFALWPRGHSEDPSPAQSASEAIRTAGQRSIESPDPDRVAGTRQPTADTTAATANVANSTGVRGRLLAPDGSPLAGVAVQGIGVHGRSLYLSGASGGIGHATARCDDDGVFTLRGLPPMARCAVVADPTGDLRQFVPLAVTPIAEQTVDAGDLHLTARSVITGRVVDPDGRPVADALVQCADAPASMLALLPLDRFDPEHGLIIGVPAPTATDQNDPGDYLAEMGRWLSTQWVQHPAPPLGDPGQTALLLDGKACEPLWHNLPIARACTAADGTFRIGGVAPGSNLVVATFAGFDTALQPRVNVGDTTVHEVGTLQLATGATAWGRVRDANGTPVIGAEVRIGSVGLLGFRGAAPSERPVRTGDDGTFELDGLRRGSIVAIARRGPDQPWTAIGPVPVDEDLEFTLPAEVDVAITWATKRPPFDAVRAYARPAPPLGELGRLGMTPAWHEVEARAIDDGRVVLGPLATGVHTLRIEAAGYTPAVHVVRLPLDEPLAVAMRPVLRCNLDVLDAAGSPCADAEVLITEPDDFDGRRMIWGNFGLSQWPDQLPRVAGRTDSLGRIELEVAAGGATIVARHPTGGVGEVAIVAPVTGLYTLRLAGTGTITGVLRCGPDSGDPRQYRIVAYPPWTADNEAIAREGGSTRPDADGRFRLEGLRADLYELSVRRALPASFTCTELVEYVQDVGGLFHEPATIDHRRVTVASGESTHLEFAIGGLYRSRGRVTGVVTIDGAAVDGLEVWARQRSQGQDGEGIFDSGWESEPRAVLDASGRFVIEDLRPKRWWLALRAPDTFAPLHQWVVDVTAGQTHPVEARIVLGAITGVLRDAAGHPVPEVDLWLHQVEDDDVYATATTDADGRFEIGDMPVGRWELGVSTPNLQVRGHAVEVLPGPARAPMEVIGATRYVVRVRLIGDTGAAPGDYVGVMLTLPGAPTGPSYSMVRGSVYELRVDAPGLHDVLIWHGGKLFEGSPRQVDVQALETEIDVSVEREVEWR